MSDSVMPVNTCALLAAAPSKGRTQSSGDLWAYGIRATQLAYGIRAPQLAYGIRAPRPAYKIRPFGTLPFGVHLICTSIFRGMLYILRTGEQVCTK